MSYSPMTMNEWDSTIDKAKNRFINEVLGSAPTRKSVAKTMHNVYAISLLEWLGLALLFCIAVVTAFKMVAVAVPFSRSFFHEDTPEGVLVLFAVSMSVTFILFSTSGLIYAALMDRYSEEINTQKKRNPKLIFSGGWQGAILGAGIVFSILFIAIKGELDYTLYTTVVVFGVLLYLGGLPTNLIQYLSPRLYHFLIYFTTVWLFVVSSNGDGNIFERYGIVFAEIALAFLVENIIEKNAKWSQAVHDAWKEAIKPYNERLNNFFTDKEFLPILYRELRESLMMLERQHPEKANKKYRPNYALFNSHDNRAIDAAIMGEYKRHTGGLRFAQNLTETEGAEPQEETTQSKKRIPPRGDQFWTVDGLMKDFLVRGLNPNDSYSEADLRSDYESGYEARTAFRNGAKSYFGK